MIHKKGIEVRLIHQLFFGILKYILIYVPRKEKCYAGFLSDLHLTDGTSGETINSGAFRTIDIVLTGSVLAGGSEAINKIMKVYTTFMQTTADKAKG